MWWLAWQDPQFVTARMLYLMFARLAEWMLLLARSAAFASAALGVFHIQWCGEYRGRHTTRGLRFHGEDSGMPFQ